MFFNQKLKLQRFFQGEGPEVGTITLNQRRIFILPTRSGVGFALILFAMFLAAINYNNSLAYLLTFLLTSVAIISILHCYRNLHGLQLSAETPRAIFAGEMIKLPLQINNPSTYGRFAIKPGWAKQIPLKCDLLPQQNQWLTLSLPSERRGLMAIPRLVIYTRYPLGMFHAWSYAQFDLHALVYPKPQGQEQLPSEQFHYQGSEGDRGRGSDDFVGQRHYHPGDSLHHLNWKALARERGILTKQFGGDRAEELVLSWQMVGNLPLEMRLSQLCRWLITAQNQQLSYGLEIPGKRIPPGNGQAHLHQCLKTLALYGEQL